MNAEAAEAEGRLPLTKAAAAVRTWLMLNRGRKITLAQARAALLATWSGEWHHVGKFASECRYYDIWVALASITGEDRDVLEIEGQCCPIVMEGEAVRLAWADSPRFGGRRDDYPLLWMPSVRGRDAFSAWELSEQRELSRRGREDRAAEDFVRKFDKAVKSRRKQAECLRSLSLLNQAEAGG